MRRYELNDEIKAVARIIREKDVRIDSSDSLQGLALINAQGWVVSATLRVVLDPAELGWAVDLAFSRDDDV